MKAYRIIVGALAVFGLTSCGDGNAPQLIERPLSQTIDPCEVLHLSEVERIVGERIDAGKSKKLQGGIRQCAWPDEEIPALVLQLLPERKSGVRGAAQVGESFLVLNLDEMDGDAAISILNPSSGSGLKPTVGVLALDVVGGLMRIAPLRVAIAEDSENYDALLEIAKKAKKRLR